jgi:hypothetical protein
MEMLELQQARTNANAEYQIARRNCRGDAECNRRAHDDQMARLQEIANRQSVETARHKNAMSQIAAVERQMRDQVKPTR